MHDIFSENTILFFLFVALYIFIENNNTKNGKKKERRNIEFGRTRTLHLRFDATTLLYALNKKLIVRSHSSYQLKSNK